MKNENRFHPAMKIISACIFALLGSVNLRAQNQRIDLIIVSGQSNAVGFDAIATELPEDPRDAQVMFWWRGGDPSDRNLINDSSFYQE